MLLSRWKTQIPFAASFLGNGWILSHCLTTTAMWLCPFWNSFNISYNGKVSGTLECINKNKQSTIEAYSTYLEFFWLGNKTLIGKRYLGILRIVTFFTSISSSGLIVNKFFTWRWQQKKKFVSFDTKIPQLLRIMTWTYHEIEIYQNKSNYVGTLLIVYWDSAMTFFKNQIHQIPGEE